MDREVCFCLCNKEVYLEQILVDYMGIPIFFICKDGNDQFYIVLCTDLEELNYIAAFMSITDVYGLLHGKLPMRDAFFKQKEYWKIISGEEITMDKVRKCPMDKLDYSVLPEEGAVFCILTEEMEEYVRRFDEEFWKGRYFVKCEKKAEMNGLPMDEDLDCFIVGIEKYYDLGENVSKIVIESEKKELKLSYEGIRDMKGKAMVKLNKKAEKWLLNEFINAAS
jgi:hypothetical protein